MPIQSNEVDAKLSFAEQRMTELLGLNGGDVGGASADDRDRLLAEFFFHLVSATEVLAQYVNDVRRLGLATDVVSVPTVRDRVGSATALGAALDQLYVNVRKMPFPATPSADPDYVLLYRVYLYRNQTTHRRRAPFTIEASARTVFLNLNPEDPTAGASADGIHTELPRMLDLIRTRCTHAITLA
jgi:hypothetical protein